MKNILITGGAGFIGSNYANLLDPDKYCIYVCDHFKNSYQWKNLKNINIEEVVLPSKISSWLKLKKNLDFIIHMGAISSTTEENINLLLKSNFELSKILWNYATIHSIPFIYASSASVYGNGENGYSDTDNLNSELVPLNAYGWSKLLFDKWALKENKMKNSPPIWSGLRFFNVYGPNENHKGEMKSMITKSFQSIIDNNKTINLFKSYKNDYKHGEQKRDFIYVNDCVEIIDWFKNGGGGSGIFNVGTGKAETWNNMVLSVYKSMDKKPSINYIDMPDNIKKHYQYFTQADISKLRQSGWSKPLCNLKDGVSNYYKNYIKNNFLT